MIRHVSPTERVWLVADSLGAPFVITLVVLGEGSLGGLDGAVEAASQANPGARGVLRGWLGGLRWEDGGPVTIRQVEPPSPGAFAERRVEGLEVGVFDGGLQLQVHHALMDGRGAWHLLEEVFRALRGEPLRGGDDGFTDAAQVGEGPSSTPIEDDLAATGVHTGDAWPIWGHRRIEGSWSGLLGRLGVAVAEHARGHGPGQVGLQVPVDLRRFGGPEGTANRTGLVRLDAPEGVTAEALGTQLDERLARGEAQAWVRSARPADGLPIWLMKLGGASKARAAIRASRFGGTAVLSNLGRVDLGALSTPSFQARRAFWVPPGGPATAAFIGLLGDDRGLELTAVVPRGLASEGRLDALLDALVDALL